MAKKIFTKIVQESVNIPSQRAVDGADGMITLTAQLPTYGTPGSAGADVYAFCPNEPYLIRPGEFAMISTGLKFELPDGFGMFILPRSSHPKNKKKIANSPGLLDEDYRGTLHVLLANTGKTDMEVKHGDSIAQLVIMPMYQMDFVVSSQLSSTQRGEGGFGSTDANKQGG